MDERFLKKKVINFSDYILNTFLKTAQPINCMEMYICLWEDLKVAEKLFDEFSFFKNKELSPFGCCLLETKSPDLLKSGKSHFGDAFDSSSYANSKMDYKLQIKNLFLADITLIWLYLKNRSLIMDSTYL